MTAQDSDAALDGRRILLGVTGGIAAYKSAELLRLFKRSGADVQVLMTPDATRFITPLTLGTLSEHDVLIEVFPEGEEGTWTRHIALGRWADIFVIAPATAQSLAKLANGFSDSMLTATALAARCPILLCPAMDHDMFVHPATRKNLDLLAAYGHSVMMPAYGPLASGLIGHGRLPEPADIYRHVVDLLQGASPENDSLSGLHVLVTAGPTREAMDPVRYLSNPSSGKMGYALAEAASRRGATVTLVSGPTSLAAPPGVTRVDVTSAREMYDEVIARSTADIVVMAAAVSDYAPAQAASQKLKKTDAELVLRLSRTPDILTELGRRKSESQILIGFAMETEKHEENARRKLKSKNLDWIVLNKLNEEGSGFETDTNRVTLIHRSGEQEDLPLMSKRSVAEAILNRIAAPPRSAA